MTEGDQNLISATAAVTTIGAGSIMGSTDTVIIREEEKAAASIAANQLFALNLP